MLTTGWKTSEFWMSIAAMVMGALQSSGLLDGGAGTWYGKIVGLVVMMLSAMGYTIPRLNAKKAAINAETVRAVQEAQSIQSTLKV